jgi:peptidoglycan/LPS O-acetylase OafA/YrhL
MTASEQGAGAPVQNRSAWSQLVGTFANWSTSRAAYPLGYSPGLDGVRGIMTLGVLCGHTRYLLMPGVIVLMDSFFAMSGYLITSLLINDYEKHGRINFRKFYTRRVMRLFPALVTMLSCLLIVALLFSSQFTMRLIDAAVSFFYISNYWRAFDGPGLWYTAHTWSLSVEEQFYLLWPLTFLLLVRRLGLSWASVCVILGTALGFAAWRGWLTYHGASVPRLYNPFDTRADALLIGCALAIAMKLIDMSKYPRLSKALAWSLLPLSLYSLYWAFTVTDHTRWYYYVSPLCGAIPAAIFTAGLLQPHRTFMHALYEHPVPVFIGRICYGLYIWHYPVFSLMRENGFSYLAIFLTGWPIAFALAIASYYLIERHFMRVRPV